MKKLAVAVLIIIIISVKAQSQVILTGKVFTTRQTPVHDPVMIKQDSMYYVFLMTIRYLAIFSIFAK